MSDRLVIVGAGGHGREALVIARAANRITDDWHEIGLVDDGDVDLEALDRVDAHLLGGTEMLDAGDDHVIAIGDPTMRRAVADRLINMVPAVTLIDPSALYGDDVVFSEGVIVFPGVICTTNVRIGRHSHVNCGTVVSHDCRVGEFVSLSPGVRLNGAVHVEDGAFLGTGAIVLPGRRSTLR